MDPKIKAKIALFDQVPLADHPSRQRCFVGAVTGLIQARNVQLPQIAKHFNPQRSVQANERRLQAFLTDFEFDYQRIALLMTLFIPRGRITLCLDRTEWKFGQCEVNILMLTARCSEVAVPLFWLLLDNQSGNSSVADRITLIEQAVALLGINRIGLLVADREFVGAEWVRYLVERQVAFCLRLPRTHPIRLRNGEVWLVEALLAAKAERFYERVLVDGRWLNVHIKQLTGNELLYLAGTLPACQLGSVYRRRWSIEVMSLRRSDPEFQREGFSAGDASSEGTRQTKKASGFGEFGTWLLSGYRPIC